MISFVDLVTDLEEFNDMKLLTPEVLVVLKATREAGELIDHSPWAFITNGIGAGGVPFHMTPRSEALAFRSIRRP